MVYKSAPPATSGPTPLTSWRKHSRSRTAPGTSLP
jgi:hypothetical protein